MVTFPCPWCDDEVALSDATAVDPRVRCDGCVTEFELASAPAILAAVPVIEAGPLLPVAA